MKTIIFALILSISLHLLILNSFNKIKEESNDAPSSSKQAKTSNIRFVQLQAKASKVSKKKTESTTPKEVKSKPVKNIVKKQKQKFIKIPKEVKKVIRRNVQKEAVIKTARKPIEKIEAVPSYQKMNPTKLQKKTLEDFLATPVKDVETLDKLTQSYIKLYGEEYHSFTKVQKVYLQKSLKNIGRVTQGYLSYPSISVRTKQQGTNIIEFMLYPNGDISKPMIISSSGYEALDDNTIETIEIAYKDYSRPKEATKIRIYVTYRLY